MKATKKEKIILGILIAILVSILYKQFVFTPLSAKLAEQKSARDKMENEYNEAMEAVNNLESNKEELKLLKANIKNKTEGFYPAIIQEKIILELDKLLAESGLNGDIAFSPVEMAAVNKLESNYQGAVEDNFQTVVDKYKKINKYDGEGKVPVIEESQNENSNEENTVGEESESTDSTGYLNIGQLKIAISFSGTYESLNDFISAINNYARTISITDVSIAATSDTNVSGTMNMEFYAVPKFDNKDLDSYLVWEFSNIYGKDSPFSEAAATGAYASTIEQLSEEADINDFIMMVKSSTSEFPTLTMGSANDAARETYLYSDKEKTQKVKIEFSEDKGKLYYKYNTEDSIFPKNKVAKEFTPISKDIVIEITSEERVNSDNSGIDLTVVNNTSTKVKVIIKNDDKKNPRVSVTGEGGTVNVTKK